MNFKKLTKSVFSLLMVSVMLLSVCSPVISAVGDIEHLHKDNAGEGKLHYVSLGASNTNGYGHHGYLDDEIYEDPLAASKANMNDYGYDKSPTNAYPALIKDALAEKTGREVELHQLAISSMRVEEVLWLLDDTYTPDEYMNWRFTGGKSWFDMAHKEGGRDALRVEYRDYISNADVITVDLGWNNFGVYAFNNIMTVIKENGARYWKAPDFDSVIDAGMEEEYYAIRDKVIERINEFVDLSETALSGDTLEMLADVLTYATFGACYNFDRVIEKIYELNPDAKVVVINIQNLADELIVNLGGTEIPLGDIYGELIEFVDLYRTSMSPHAGKYGFAYAGDNGDVDTFLDEFRLWDGDPATLSQDMKDLFDMYDDNLYVRSKIEYLMVGQALSGLFKNLRDMGSLYGFPVFTNDAQYTYEFALDMAWLNGVDLAALDFNNPDTPLEEYGAAVSKHLVNLRNYETYGKDAYNYVFEDLTNLLMTRKTETETQKGIAEAMKDGFMAQKETLIKKKTESEAQLEMETNPNNQEAIKNSISQYEELISQCDAQIAEYEQLIAQADAGIAQLDQAITSIIPFAKQGFDDAYAGLYMVYNNTLNYAYDTVGTIVQYTLQFNTFYMTPESMANHNQKTDALMEYVIGAFTNNTMLKFYEELGKIGMDSSGAVAPEIAVNEEFFEDLGIQAACALEVRYDFGNSFFAHPSVKGNRQIKDAVMDVLENGSDADAFTDMKINQYVQAIEDFLNSYYEDGYADLKANGTIDSMLNVLDLMDAALDSLEADIRSYAIPAEIDAARAENIRALLLEEIDNTRITSEKLRRILATESLNFNSECYAELVSLVNNLEDHASTLSKLALEIGYLADSYLAELNQTVIYYVGILNDMAVGSYEYLVNEVEEFETQYLEFVELVGSYADKIDSSLGTAIRDYLIDTPRDAIIIICQYGEDALLKLIVDVLDTTDSLTASIGTIISIVMDHGAEIYGEIAADPEYRELVSAIESKNAELMQLYNDLKDHPLVTAIDIDKRIAKEIGDLEILYYQLINVVTKNVRAYDEQVADILITALYDIVDEFGIFAEAGKDYLGWLEGHSSLMVGALLHSFLQNTLELGEVADEVIINYANKLAKLTKEFCTELAENIKAAVRKKVKELAVYGHELENIVTLKVIEIVDEVTEFVTISLDDAVNGEYTPDDNSYYVAIAGNNSEYAQMLAAALGLSDRHTVMGWDNIDKNVLYGADFVTLGYDRTAVSGFAVDQFLAAVALYGDESFREQLSDYLAVALADDFSQEELELLLTNIDNAIVNALEGPVFNGKTVQDMDWAELIGEENVALVNEMLAEIEIYLEEYGIMDEWVVSINVPNLLSNYLLNIHYFDNAPVFELSLPASETVMLAVESYIYSNIAFYKEYAETIIDLVENNPDVEIAVLGQYNPFSDMTVNGISIPLGEIYGKLVTVSNIHAFAYAFALPNVTYVDISDAETAWDSISDPSDLLNAYLENPEGDVFTDESNLYVMNQILAAYNLSCKHAYDGCTDDTCNVCGAIRNNAGHSYTSSVTEPDCVRGGYTTHTCTVCGDSYIDNRTDALGHQYDNACDAECNVCHEQRTPADHVFGEWILIVAPTGESEGREERVCSVCGEVESRVVPMLELSYNVGEIIAIVIGSGVVLFGVVAQVATFIRKRKESNVE